MSTTLGSIGGGGLSADSSRLASKTNLDAAGTRFEAIFTGMMLKSMRSAKLSDGLFESKALDQFRDMQDQQLAQSMATHTPIGIGKAMTEFLAKAATFETPTASHPGEGGGSAAASPEMQSADRALTASGPWPSPGNCNGEARR